MKGSHKEAARGAAQCSGRGGSGRKQDKNSGQEGSLGWEAGASWVSSASSWLSLGKSLPLSG